jgi:hypothetical protein
MGDKPDGNAGQAAEQMATQLFSETSPFRNALYGNWANFLGVPAQGQPQQPNLGGAFGLQQDPGSMIYNPNYNYNASNEAAPVGQTNQIPWDVSQSPVFGPAKSMLEQQYQNAQENIIANMPTGGGMMEALAGTEQARAKGLGDISSQIAQDEYNKIFSTVFGMPQTSISGLTNLAGQQAMAASQQQAGKAGALGDIGMGAGLIAATK